MDLMEDQEFLAKEVYLVSSLEKFRYLNLTKMFSRLQGDNGLPGVRGQPGDPGLRGNDASTIGLWLKTLLL